MQVCTRCGQSELSNRKGGRNWAERGVARRPGLLEVWYRVWNLVPVLKEAITGLQTGECHKL